MSKQTAEHHKKATEHHEHAARHHKKAAKDREAGNQEKAALHVLAPSKIPLGASGCARLRLL